LNVRPGSPWEGLANPPQVETKSGNFCNFVSPVYGFRAAFKIYKTKADRGITTLRALITEWAPPSENDTEKYIARVSKRTGFGPDDKINLIGWTASSAICRAQCEVESGEAFADCWKESDMQEGARRAGIAGVPGIAVPNVTPAATAATGQPWWLLILNAILGMFKRT
jgi:hypothetical protein